MRWQTLHSAVSLELTSIHGGGCIAVHKAPAMENDQQLTEAQQDAQLSSQTLTARRHACREGGGVTGPLACDTTSCDNLSSAARAAGNSAGEPASHTHLHCLLATPEIT